MHFKIHTQLLSLRIGTILLGDCFGVSHHIENFSTLELDPWGCLTSADMPTFVCFVIDFSCLGTQDIGR